MYNTVRDSCDVMRKALSSPLLYGSCVDPVSNHVDEQGVTRYRSNNQSLPALYTPTLMARCHPTLYTRTVETVKRRCLSHVPVREFLSLSLFPVRPQFSMSSTFVVAKRVASHCGCYNATICIRHCRLSYSNNVKDGDDGRKTIRRCKE